MSRVDYCITRYGFVYGAATVERAASHKGHVVVSIKTPRQQMHIRITPSGLIRLDEDKKAREG